MWLTKAHTSQEAPTSTSGSSSLNIEPTILNVYEMSIGTDLIFIEEDGDKYFINAKTNEQIREKVKSPFMIAFEKNLSFLRKDEYSKEFIEAVKNNTNLLDLISE